MEMMETSSIIQIIGAIGILFTTCLTAWAAFRAKTVAEVTKSTVDDVQKVNVVQTKKLDNITVLVDGRYGEVLQELADVKRLLSLQTGADHDISSAAKAQDTADAQHERTAAATAAITAGGGVQIPDTKKGGL